MLGNLGPITLSPHNLSHRVVAGEKRAKYEHPELLKEEPDNNTIL